jgi:hypothetical protein
MKDQLDRARETLSRIAAFFLILWFITAVTDLLGKYEYEMEFLLLAVVFYLLSRVPTAFRRRYSTGKKIEKCFTNVGWPLIGLWIGFNIFRWIGWFGPMEIGTQDIVVDIDYFLAFGILLVLVGYAAKSLHRKAGYWALRSILFAVGGVSLLLWILIKLFDIFVQYTDVALVVGLVAIGAGYILGGLRKPPTFFVGIDEDDVEPEVSEDISVTEEDITIARGKTKVKISKGSLFIPIIAEKEIGGIYFGEGSYQVDAKVKVYSDVYRGVTLVSGAEWSAAKKGQRMSPADEKAFDDIGLKREEVLELAQLQMKGGLTNEVRKRLKRTSVNLPFIKIRETPHGEYVKVGPLEFEETADREHVRFGPWEFSESGRQRFTRKGLFIQIRSRDEDIAIASNGKTVFKKGDMHISVTTE